MKTRNILTKSSARTWPFWQGGKVFSRRAATTVWVGAATAILALASSSRAADFIVSKLNDAGPGSLRAAIEEANATPDADVIRFRPGLLGIIALTSGQLNITEDLSIFGPGEQVLTVSGNHASRVFRVAGAGTDVVMTDLTIADGLATDVIDTGSFGTSTGGGGILNLGGSVTLSQVTVANNVSDTQATAPGEAGKPAQSYGGGIFNRTGARFAATHCTFRGNIATAARVGSNFQFHGGGAILNDSNSIAQIQFSVFTGNRTTDAGGAIYNSAGSQLFLSQTRFEDNGALFAGGAIDSLPTGLSGGLPATVAVENSQFFGNWVIGDLVPGGGASGGAIRSIGGSLTVEHSHFANNEARGGNNLAVGNGGLGRGGAIYTARSGPAAASLAFTTTIANSQFINNLAAGGNGSEGRNGGEARGGALTALGLGLLEVHNSIFEGNEAAGGMGTTGGNALGGGVHNDQVTATVAPGTVITTVPTTAVTDCAIASNLAVAGPGVTSGNARGGGIYNGNPANGLSPIFVLTRSNVAANEADGGAGEGKGGGIYNGGLFSVDQFSPVEGNKASTSDDDVFGILTPL